MRERSLTSICACAASWVTLTDCTAWRAQLSLRCPQLPTLKACPAHGPAYPVEQLLWGQDFAIFIQPERGGPKLPALPWWARAAPSPSSTPSPRLPGDPARRTPRPGQGYLYVLHSTRREYTESKSLSTSRPAAWGAG